LSVKPHPFFTRDEDNILFELPINFAQASLGTEVDIPTLGGSSTRLKVPAGSQTGKIFRMKNEGIAHLHGRGRGDLVVRLFVMTPEKLTREQRRLLEELAQTLDPIEMPGQKQ
jgi:molecular chaperone DnaJ